MGASPAKTHPNIGVAVCVAEIGGDPSEIQLFPTGSFRAIDGRPAETDSWRIDGAIAARVISRASARSGDMVIDYEHQTDLAPTNGQPAPAAGWFSGGGLKWEAGRGLFAVARWTDRAKGMILSREYRYISPVFAYDRKTGEVLAILRAALTNNPGLDGMAEVVARATASFSDDLNLEEPMNKDTLALLGLKEGADESAIATAVAALKSGMDEVAQALGLKDGAGGKAVVTAITALRSDLAAATEALGLKEGATSDEITQAVATLKAQAPGDPDPARYVPISVAEQLKADLAALTAKVNGSEVEDLVTAALADGRLLEAQADWARALGGKDIAALKSYIEKTPPIAALKGTQTGGKAPAGAEDGALSDEELAVCKAMGLAPEEFKKTREAETAAA